MIEWDTIASNQKHIDQDRQQVETYTWLLITNALISNVSKQMSGASGCTWDNAIVVIAYDGAMLLNQA
jgi:hypothetical protein